MIFIYKYMTGNLIYLIYLIYSQLPLEESRGELKRAESLMFLGKIIQ